MSTINAAPQKLAREPCDSGREREKTSSQTRKREPGAAPEEKRVSDRLRNPLVSEPLLTV
jgi:hypothetical protein